MLRLNGLTRLSPTSTVILWIGNLERLTEAAKRIKLEPVAKKTPISPRFKEILDVVVVVSLLNLQPVALPI